MEGEEDAGGLRGGCVELHQGAVSRGRGDGVLAFFGGGVFFHSPSDIRYGSLL